MTTIDSELLKIGPRIKTIRKERRMTQKKLADKLEVSNSFVNQLESSKRIPCMDMLLNIARELKVPPTVLLLDLSPDNTSVPGSRDPIIETKQAIPLFQLDHFDFFSRSKSYHSKTIEFGTHGSDLAGVKLDDNSMFPEFSSSDIVIIDRHFDCKTNWKTGDRNLLENIKSGMYIICHIAKERFAYPEPNNLMRRIQFHNNGKEITLCSSNEKFNKHLKVKADSEEHNVDVLHILGVVIGKITFYDYRSY